MAAKKKTKLTKPTLKIIISGPQGIGKSTLAEALGRAIAEMGLDLRSPESPEIWIDGWRGSLRSGRGDFSLNSAPLLQDALRQTARDAGVIEITTPNEPELIVVPVVINRAREEAEAASRAKAKATTSKEKKP